MELLKRVQDRITASLESIGELKCYVADTMAGMHLAVALGARCHQVKTGEGQLVVMPMADAMVSANALGHPAGEVFCAGRGTGRQRAEL
ncbi:MAG: hypothetical protein QM662_04120 [Gordonia sp. (in: high G+C Gram-positive bacteria)]